jgi:hypothetical protein
MIFALFKNLISLIKSVAKSIKGKIIALARKSEHEAPEKSPARKFNIASETRCARNKGPLTRRTGGHAPIYSLFTYFGDRQ